MTTSERDVSAEDKAERERLIAQVKLLGKIIRDMVVANQAAYIEWKHGKGAEAAMRWVANWLLGPGHIPDPDAPWGKEAQAFYDANKSDPFPTCHCGRPSNILSGAKGYCSDTCYRKEHWN